MTSTLIKPEFVLPAKMFMDRSGGRALIKKGMEQFPLNEMGLIMGMAGGDRGFHAHGDIVTETADGVSLNDLWRDYQAMLREYNARRDPLFNFLTWRTTRAAEEEISGGTLVDFEEASQYGEPVGVRPKPGAPTSLGYTFKWYDIGARYTWQYLADAPAADVDQVANAIVEADNRAMFLHVMKTLFNNTRRVNKEGQTVYPFYSGAAGDGPPDFGTVTFADNHNHYVTSGGATVTAANLEALQTLVREHGYSVENGYSLVLMINEAQENEIRQFRMAANAPAGYPAGRTGNYDFIPAQGTVASLMPVDLQMAPGTTRPAATLRGMTVIGGYSEMVIVKNSYIPAGYMVLFVTGGEQNIQNPIAVREHPNAALRGLRLVKGRTPDYPLLDSFWNRGFGTGIRRRGAGAIMQITAAGSYSVPAQYVW